MAIQRIKIANDTGEVFSPYTGESCFNASKDGTNLNDASLVFSFYGDAGEYDDALKDRMEAAGISFDADPSELSAGVDLIIEVDAGWSGLAYLGYKAVPAPEQD